jgi:adenylate cyclase
MERDLSSAPLFERRRRAIQLFLTGLVIASAVFLATLTSPWRLAELRVFDYFSTASPPHLTDTAPIIVAIDESSLAEIGLRWPWPRELHAKLVQSLRAAGAKAIGLDIIFAEPSAAADDAALAGVMGPDIILAADETVIRTPHADQHIRVEPLPTLAQAGALVGVVTVNVDGDGVVRRLPAEPDDFAVRVLQAARPSVLGVTARNALMQTFGPARTFETVSYYQALDPAAFLPEGKFRDRIVLVGLSTQSAASIDQGGADLYETSYTIRSRNLIAGVELQATILENLARHHFVTPASSIWTGAATAFGAVLAVVAVWRGTGRITGALTLTAILAFMAASLAGVLEARYFLAPLAPSLAFAGVAGVQSARDYASERRRRMRVVHAFSQYLSPVLVNRLAEGNEPLRLGGQLRVLTVLFCDVRGFTAISEEMRHDPEGLTRLMNRLLNPLSDVILKAGGTIDKYMGDAIMAFWNAPLDDPDHALHATEAALGMLAAVEALNTQRASEATAGAPAPPPLRIGIGINTGECVVGNLGSEFRFNYSALGDPVNLAARLESETKSFGVPILIGEETMSHLEGRMNFAELGRVTVRGKSLPVVVGTPVTVGDLAAMQEHSRLIADWRSGRLEALDVRLKVLARDLPQLSDFYKRIEAELSSSAER